MYYKNTSNFTYTYHGVTFKPGDIKNVFGYINNPKFIKVDKPVSNSVKAEPKKETKVETKRESQAETRSDVENKPKSETKKSTDNLTSTNKVDDKSAKNDKLDETKEGNTDGENNRK